MAETKDWGSFKAEQDARLVKQTGEGIEAWGAKMAAAGLSDQPAIRAWLAERGISGYLRMFLVWERLGYPDFINATADELVDAQYADRADLRPIYDAVVEAAVSLGDVTVQTRKTYVSLVTPRRTFVRVQATTRKRVDVALRLDAEPGGRLVKSRHENMPVQFGLTSPAELDAEAMAWLQAAFEQNT